MKKRIIITWHGARPRANVYRGLTIRRYWLTTSSLRRLALLLVLLLAACGPAYSDPYIQRAAADAAIQATQAALSEIAMSATIQAAQTRDAQESRALALQMQTTATAQVYEFVRLQTQAAATAQRESIEATRQAEQATSTAQAAMDATKAAYPPQATATAAALNEIARADRERELRARWEAWIIPLQALLPSILWAVVVILAIIGAALAYRRLMPVVELRLRAIPRGEHDAPLILLQNLIIDPDKAFGPALRLTEGGAESTGHAPTPLLQERTTARSQAVDLVRAMPHEPRERRQAERYLAALPIPSPQSETPQVEVIEPGDSGHIAQWLTEVEHKLLTESEGEA